MAEVLDIVQRLTFDVQGDELQQTVATMNKQIQTVGTLNGRLAKMQQLLDATTADDAAKRTRIIGIMDKQRSAIEAINTSLLKEIQTNKKLQNAVNAEAALLNKVTGAKQGLAKATTQLTTNTGDARQATFALSQILRETPAFAFSVQTGLLAISNNIPILVDEFNRLKVSQGGVNTALKTLGRSLFSFPNLITVGVGLLTIFSGKLIELATSEKEATKETEAFNKAQKDLADTIGKELAAITSLAATAANIELSYKDRGKAIDELQKQYPDYFGALDREKILNGEVQATYDALTASIIKRARVTAQQKKLDELFSSQFTAQQRLDAIQNPAPNTFVISTPGEEEELERRLRGLAEQIRKVTGAIQQENETFEDSALAIDEKTRKEFEAYRKKERLEILTTDEEKKEQEKRLKEFQSALDKRKEAYENALREFKQLTLDALNDPDLKDIVDSTLGGALSKVQLEQFLTTRPEVVRDAESGLTDVSGIPGAVDPARLAAQLEIREDLKAKELKEAEERKTARQKELDEIELYYNSIAQAALIAFSAISQAQRRQIDEEIRLREKRVTEATELAERGNTEVLRIERQRLAEALADREEAARREVIINQGLALSNAALAIAKAAGQTGAGAIAVVPAVIAAIFAGYGLVSAATRDATSNIGFKDGGYTGNKGVNEEAGVVHGQEFVVNAENTRKFRPMLELMNEGKMPVTNNFASRMELGSVEKKLDSLIVAVEMSGTKVNANINERGVAIITERYKKQQRRQWS